MKNLVYIETYNSHGSGVIFPCESNYNNSYIIITNFHVVKDIDIAKDDIKDSIDLEFYDNNGRKVDKKFINKVFVAYGNVYDNENDIAALLVILEDVFFLEFEDIFLFGDIQEELVYTEGYPEVLKDDDVNRSLKLEGKIESPFPKMDKIGIYKMQNDVHWYDNYSDKELLEGLSGGPVYFKKNDRNVLIGINQSLCNIGDGCNPFKIMYFIQIKQVFEWLRDQGIIIFEYNFGQIKIEWIAKRTLSKTEDSTDVLLLGGSGAGKSSFIKELMLHGETVNACGDGQTTRMDVNYNLWIYCKKPKIGVKFLSKDNFSKILLDLTKMNRIEYIFTEYFFFQHINLSMDMLGYLKFVLSPLEVLSVIFRDKEYDNTISNRIDTIIAECKKIICKNENAEKEEIVKLYEMIIRMFVFLIDKDVLTKNQIGLVFFPDGCARYNEFIHEESINEYEYISLKQYILFVLNGDEMPFKLNYEKIELFDSMNVSNGYFDIREFYFLDSALEGEVQELYNDYKNSIENMYFNNSTEEELEENDEQNKNSRLKQYYVKIHESISKFIYKYYSVKQSETGNTKSLELDGLDKPELLFLERCLKVVKGESLTGIIEKIDIHDSISNNYSYMMKKRGLNHLRFIDTCGLDHIDRGTGIKRYLDKVFMDYKEKKNKFDAIFYVKKLDSGKPMELENLIPMVYNSCPGKPIFCIFTGADIYYSGREYLLLEREWSSTTYEQSKKIDDKIIPKSVSYFYENDNVVKKMPCSDEWKDIIYRVISENLIPFISNTTYRSSVEFIVSNRRYLEKLFEAIMLDEWNAGYIDSNSLIELFNETNNVLYTALEKDIKKMFYTASLFDWNKKHHMTVNANISRILGRTKENSMGYNGVSEDRWDYLLREGYQEVFLKRNSEIIKYLNNQGIGKNTLEIMFAKLKDDIVCIDMKYRKLKSNNIESKFRKIFVRMYSNRDIYIHNPFGVNKIYLKNQKEKRDYLLNICNFRKGLENNEILDDFKKLFCEEISSYINEENKKRIQLLLDYKDDFGKNINSVIDEIEKFVGKKNQKWILEVISEVINIRK